MPIEIVAKTLVIIKAYRVDCRRDCVYRLVLLSIRRNNDER